MIHQHVSQAYQRIKPYIVKTPLAYSPLLSDMSGSEVYLKCEHTQHTGSFKLRGALSKATALPASIKERGIITASSGNHGMAVSLAGKITGMKARIYVPESISPAKEKTILALGGELIKVPGSSLDAELTAAKAAAAEGLPFISPYNDDDIIAGQGTIGLEIVDQLKTVGPCDALYASVGGGGLISGIGGYMSEHSPTSQMVGCWPANAAAMADCLEAGEIYDVVESDTISDGTAGGVEPGAVTFDHCQRYLNRHQRVSEEEIIAAMKHLADHERWIVEGAAGVALASFLKEAESGIMKGKTVVIVLCGRNIAFDKFHSLMQS